MAAPDLAVIITSFEMPWHLRRALESIACQRTKRRFEVIVGDDGSRDETPQMVADFAAKAAFPVRFVTHPHTEFHAARCRNEGVQHSSAPHLLFFDGDCLLPPDHIERHLEAWRPGSATCSYCVRLEQSVSQQVTLESVGTGQFLKWASTDQRRALRNMHFKAVLYATIGHPTKPALRSTDFSVARADYERINGFDENFQGWGCEDDDFGRRLRAAGVRMISVLNRTFVYHLWHPPAPTRPQQWKRGANVAYLQRDVRLTRCIRGLAARQPRELTVRLQGEAVHAASLNRLLTSHGWSIEPRPQPRADLELICRPGNGRFGGRADCRVLAVFDDDLAGRIDTGQAHVVLSGRGSIGRADQVRLMLDDVSGLWAAIQGTELLQRRAAA
jgi:GT2 family glycosyltransferase